MQTTDLVSPFQFAAQYYYAKENIVLLVDDNEDPLRRPTRDNILRELSRLVQETQSGDRFFFYYAGHSDRAQSPTANGEMVKFLVPCDYWMHPQDVPIEERMILSRELRMQFIDRLPFDTDTYAVFDACSAGRFLDLLHYRCNNIYIPWISPGFRRCMTMWRHVRRRNGCIVDDIELALEKGKSSTVPKRSDTTPINSRASTASSIHIYRGKRVSQDEIHTVKTSVNINGKGKSRRISVESRKPSIHRQSGSLLGQAEGSVDVTPLAGRLVESPDIIEDLRSRQCTSPIQTADCDGFDCKTFNDVVMNGPNVITISSSRETQKTWDHNRDTFTQTLIRALQDDPYQPLEQLVKTLTFRANKLCRRLHSWSKSKRENLKQEALQNADHGIATLFDPVVDEEARNRMELVNFFEPQVGSQRPMV
ncbi:hypothetical protein BC628DRAFT_1387745 [Trametes gibbosa]|nr:hypothetical protein BC628DRAFT_1387745 [Trametes gibbosa]